eukprot:403330860
MDKSDSQTSNKKQDQMKKIQDYITFLAEESERQGGNYTGQFMKNLTVKDIEYEQGILGRVTFDYNMSTHMINGHGVGHGGALATIMTVIPIIAMKGFDSRRAQSQKLTTEYLNQTPLGKDLQIISTIHKIGRRNAYTDCVLVNPSNPSNKYLVKGTLMASFVENTEGPKL